MASASTTAPPWMPWAFQVRPAEIRKIEPSQTNAKECTGEERSDTALRLPIPYSGFISGFADLRRSSKILADLRFSLRQRWRCDPGGARAQPCEGPPPLRGPRAPGLSFSLYCYLVEGLKMMEECLAPPLLRIRCFWAFQRGRAHEGSFSLSPPLSLPPSLPLPI